MSAQIRKTCTIVETTLIEGGRPAPRPLRLIAALAVLRNPWAGRGFVEDLRPEIHAVAPELGRVLTDLILDAAGGRRRSRPTARRLWSGWRARSSMPAR